MLGCSFALPHKSARQIYVEALEQGRLLYQLDEDTQQAVFYPREVGPGGDPKRLVWRESRGYGEVYSFTTIEKARANVVLVDLDEGFRMMSTVLNCEPCALKIGMRVRAKVEASEGGCRLVFEVSNEV